MTSLIDSENKAKESENFYLALEEKNDTNDTAQLFSHSWHNIIFWGGQELNLEDDTAQEYEIYYFVCECASVVGWVGVRIHDCTCVTP